eukprot:scaffold17_cov354-Pavlova_lutheri.AAC.42
MERSKTAMARPWRWTLALVGMCWGATWTHATWQGHVGADASELAGWLDELGEVSDAPTPGAVTRLVFTPSDLQARKFVTEKMVEAGMTVRADKIGNLFGRWEGRDKKAASILTGSHCDAVPLAGRFDGVVGVLGGIAAVKALKKAGFRPQRSIEVMMFTSEEPTRFGLSCSGSRAMAGVLSEDTVTALRDENGTTYLDAAKAAGYGAKSIKQMLEDVKVKDNTYEAFVELHIEQGPILEQQGIHIGAVRAIAAPAAIRVRFYGSGGHAGALLMHYRNDAALAGAELALATERAALATGAEDTVATVGVFRIQPDAVNSVPREALLEIDVRDIDGPRRDKVVAKILSAAESIAATRKVRMEYEMINQDPPATCGQHVVEAVTSSAKELGFSVKSMVSRAYHDSLFMAKVAPTAMIFIPCRDGVSHRPDEFAAPEDLKRGVETLALTMAKLSVRGYAEEAKEEL